MADVRISEIEAKLKAMGDYVKIDYLNRILKDQTSSDVKKFIFVKLADLYFDKGMYSEAGKKWIFVGDMTLKQSEKNSFYMRAAQSFIKASAYIDSEEALKKAFQGELAVKDINAMKSAYKEMFKRQAEEYEKIGKRNKAVELYERLLKLEINDVEKDEIKKKLLALYGSLGKIREFRSLGGFESS